MKFPNKFPTLIGLFLILACIGTILLVERMLRSPSGASGSHEPKNIHITNISETSFAFSWTTDALSIGTILVSSSGMSNRIYYDERDDSGKLGKYNTHRITVRDAHPNTGYTIKLMSDGSQYLNQGKPYGVQTASSLPTNTNSMEPAYGTILSDNGTPIDGALVYLTIDGGQELSTITKPSGLWLIPLNQVRTQDLSSFLPTIERMNESIVAEDNILQATATTDTLNDSPVPDMTLGKNFDFRKQQAKTTGNTGLALRATPPPAPPVATSNLPIGGAVLGESTTSRTFSVSLTTPVQGAALPTTLPLIQGTGVPNKYVGISVGILQPQTGSVKVGLNGLWSYTPTKPLAPGNQSVTMTSIDNKGKTIAITHTFEILKSGTQVLGVATPSATIAPIETLSTTPVIIPTSTLSGQIPPTSGNAFPTLLLLVLGLGLFASGTLAVIR